MPVFKVGIKAFNNEGREIMAKRSIVAEKADKDLMIVYERLLQNKRDRVVVPIENRCCSGCHISITAQHENLVRKGERLVFCEHCSRIHYWLEHLVEQEAVAPGLAARRRRRVAAQA